MLDAAFIHLKRTGNIGDQVCSPGSYFDFGAQDSFDFNDPEIPDCNLAIMGGGQVFQGCVESTIYKTAKARNKVIWGVGISPKDRASMDYDIVSGSCALVSTRNWGVDDCTFVPCASAMSPHFDAPPDPVHEVVVFAHAKKSGNLTRVKGIPTRTNYEGPMADIIAFLASGETVVTNSYHGTFWAMCLGRRVICAPFNNKFHYFQHNPVITAPDNWVTHLKHAERRPGVLEDARSRNLAFYEQVRNLT